MTLNIKALKRKPMIRDIKFENMGTGKKQAKPNIRLSQDNPYAIFTGTNNRQVEVVGYVDPVTGFFKTHDNTFVTKNEPIVSVFHEFKMLIHDLTQEKIVDKLNELKSMKEDRYEELGYKPLNKLAQEFSEYLDDKYELFKEVHKQIKTISSGQLPKYNNYCLFDDQSPFDVPHYVTAKLPYKQPQLGMAYNKELVDDFLDVFLNEEDKQALMWYYGACLSNKENYDDTVSKMVFVSSSRGGSGKSTLIMGLTKALLTNHYAAILDVFDVYFKDDNRFATSDLPDKRMNVYLEADFCVAGKDGKAHDFSGLNVNTLKSLIVDGYMNSEPKHNQKTISLRSGMHIALTNNPPVITDKSNEAMARRLLPVMVKPTTMREKADQLGLGRQQNIYDFLEKHAFDFAMYAFEVYQTNPNQYDNFVYDHELFVESIEDGDRDLAHKNKRYIEELREQKEHGLSHVISYTGKLYNIDVVPLLAQLTTANENVIIADNYMYINSSKYYLNKMTSNGDRMYDVLFQLYGPAVKKNGKRMFPVPLTINATFETPSASENETDTSVETQTPNSPNRLDVAFNRMDTICNYRGINARPFLENLIKQIGVDTDNIRQDGSVLYINGSKNYLATLDENAQTFRKLLIELYGLPVKQFGKRMFAIPVA